MRDVDKKARDQSSEYQVQAQWVKETTSAAASWSSGVGGTQGSSNDAANLRFSSNFTADERNGAADMERRRHDPGARGQRRISLVLEHVGLPCTCSLRGGSQLEAAPEWAGS